MFQSLRHKTEREEEYKDMTLESSKRGFHRSPGTSSSVVKGNETRLIRCVNCGFTCDRERDPRSPEDSWVFLGINYGPQLTAGPSIGDSKYPVLTTIPADPNLPDANTKTLLHLDTDFTDSELTPKVWTAHGGAVISSAQSVFGGASVRIPSASTSYIDTPAHADFNFGTGPATIECRVFFSTLPASNQVIFWYGNPSTGNDWGLMINSSGQLRFFAENTVSTICDLATSGLSLSTGVFYSLVFVRNGTSIAIYLNGISQALSGTSLGATALPTGTTPFTFGARSNAHDLLFNGFVDEIRISNVARETANFAVQTSAFNMPIPSYTTYIERGPDLYYDRTMSGGCPCCGSHIYDKKPQEVNLP